MDVFEAMERRRSIRKFTDDPVPDEDIVKIITAASQAPSGGNQQMWYFIVIRNKAVMDKMRQAVLNTVDKMLEWPEIEGHEPRVKAIRGYGTFFADAPVTIAALTKGYEHYLDGDLLPKHGLSFEQIYRLRGDAPRQSFGAAVQNLHLAALALGYGTCSMTGPLYAGPELESILGVEEPWALATIIPLGRPAEQPAARPRKPLEETYRIIE